MKKGSKLYVEGRLTTRSWEDKESGKKMYRTEIVVGEISLLSGNGKSNGRSSNSDRADAPSDQDNHGAVDFDGLGIIEAAVPF